MAEQKVYSTTVLGSGPRKASGSAEVSGRDNGNVEYKESKSKTPRTAEEKKALRTIQVGTVGAFAAAALASAAGDAKRDYTESRVRQKNRESRERLEKRVQKLGL